MKPPQGDEGEPILAIDGTRATIRLNRPSKHNKLTPEDLTRLLQHLSAIERNTQVRALVLAADGASFSAGYDLGAMARRTAQDGDEEGGLFERVVNRLEHLTVPTIARLQGGVYGGATDLALACDFRIGVDGCEMRMPAARLGLHFYASGLQRYTARLGIAAAKRLLLLAEPIDAAEMLRIGFLDTIASADALDARVSECADRLASHAPAAVQGMKRSINEIAEGRFDGIAADRRYTASLAGPDLREGIAALAEKRAPRF